MNGDDLVLHGESKENVSDDAQLMYTKKGVRLNADKRKLMVLRQVVKSV